MRGRARLLAMAIGAAPALAAGDTIGGREEAWWRAASLAREADVAARAEEVAACEEREAPPAYDSIDGYVTRGVRDGRLRWVEIHRCDEERSALEAAREALDRFEDDARALGVPPGWLR